LKRYNITIEVDEKEVRIIYKNSIIYVNPATKRCDIITLLRALDKTRAVQDES